MNKRSTAPARAAAVAALVVAAIVVVVAIGAALSGGGSDSGSSHSGGNTSRHVSSHKQPVPATYEIQSGDTLISIAHSTGVPVKEIEALNPQVDPQILVAGEVLKLR